MGIGQALVETCLVGLGSIGIPKCNIFLFSDNAAGAAFWLHNGWLSRADLQVLQKAVPPSGRAAAYNRVGRESH
jgi:hypothetical protein